MSGEDGGLRHMLADMEAAPDLYKPTNFWNSGLEAIVKDIEAEGMENFRTHPSAAFFYVPVYASNTLRKYGKYLLPLVDRMRPRKRAKAMVRLTRSDRARLDYRILRATSVAGGLDIDSVSESDAGGGERFEFDGKSYSRSMLNYMRALNLLKKTVDTSGIRSVLEIGGGYGTLGEILLKAQPEGSLYVNVDIPPVAAVSTYYLQQVFGADQVLCYTDSREMAQIDLEALKGRYKAVVLCPWQLPKLKGQFDLFANFMSFQEMEPDVVANYISLVAPLTAGHVITRNTAVGKKIAQKAGDIGVFEQVTTKFITEQFQGFDTLAADAFVYGEMNDSGSYVSQVLVLGRRGA